MNRIMNPTILKGLWKENPITVSLLGLCSTLAVTTAIPNAIGMGVAFTFVLICSNIIISLIKSIVPDEIRIPIFIVVIATFVTIVEMFMNAYLPSLALSLGTFLPLIVVNCIILGRAEAFASKNNVLESFYDAVGMGLGYTAVLIFLSLIRGFFGTGSIYIWGNLGVNFNTMLGGTIDNPLPFFSKSFFTTAPSAFILLGFILGFAGLINTRNSRKEAK